MFLTLVYIIKMVGNNKQLVSKLAPCGKHTPSKLQYCPISYLVQVMGVKAGIGKTKRMNGNERKRLSH